MGRWRSGLVTVSLTLSMVAGAGGLAWAILDHGPQQAVPGFLVALGLPAGTEIIAARRAS